MPPFASPPTQFPTDASPFASDSPERPAEEPISAPSSFSGYIASQMGRDDGSETGGEDGVAAKRAGVYNFLQVPLSLEPMLCFGYLTCLDCFLQLFTFLPLRVLYGAWSLARRRRLSATQSCDVMRGLMIVVVSYLLLGIDMSQAYHSVRNQAMLKLYVIFNVLEIFDKLCASFGQDILESLYDAAARRRR